MESTGATILLTGATGFVGGYLHAELRRCGYRIRCTTRDPVRARKRHPDWDWVRADLSDTRQAEEALAGCNMAFYLVHGMAEGEGDFHRRELEAAERFARAAQATGIQRIVYLGGFEPKGRPSSHLLSRLEVGEALRSGPVPTLELRASMIVGHGSLSWLIVRDLAARLPFMLLPRWLNSRTQPVAIDDVVLALRRGLEIDLPAAAWYDIPGRDTLSAREIMERIAQLMGLRKPVCIQVPVLSPGLSSHWVHFVTRAEWSVAREVVIGLTEDFLAHDARYWELIGHQDVLGFDEAARRALAEERKEAPPAGFWGAVERWRFRGRKPGWVT